MAQNDKWKKMDDYAKFLIESHNLLMDLEQCQKYFPEDEIKKDFDFHDRNYNYYHNRYLLRFCGQVAQFFHAPLWGKDMEGDLMGALKKKHLESMVTEFSLFEGAGFWYIQDTLSIKEFAQNVTIINGKEVKYYNMALLWLSLTDDQKLIAYEKFIQQYLKETKIHKLTNKHHQNAVDDFVNNGLPKCSICLKESNNQYLLCRHNFICGDCEEEGATPQSSICDICQTFIKDLIKIKNE